MTTRTYQTAAGSVALRLVVDNDLAELLSKHHIDEEGPPEDLQEWLHKQGFLKSPARRFLSSEPPRRRGIQYIPLEREITPQEWSWLMSPAVPRRLHATLQLAKDRGRINTSTVGSYQKVERVNEYFGIVQKHFRFYQTSPAGRRPRYHKLFALA